MDLLDFLDRKLIMTDLKARDKADAIRQMAELLDRNGRLYDLEAFVDAVFKREEEFSTAIGFNVAIPHGKSAGVKTPSLVVAKSHDGVDFHSDQGDLSNLLFLMAIPENNAGADHLRLLSKISRMILKPGFREELIASTSTDEVLETFRKFI